MDALALAGAIASGALSADAAIGAALQAVEDRAHLGAVVRLAPVSGVPAAGPFAGVPFLAKDLGAACAGLPSSAGSAALMRKARDELHSDLFTRFRAAGLVPFGLSAVPPFGLALTSEPEGAPPARNPWDESLSPGGSSGGAASAVAGGIVAIAHATDAAGSIRVPAACCGLVGLKPGRGAVPLGPDFGNHLMGLASELVLARSVRDVLAAFDAVTGGVEGPCPDAAAQPVPEQPRVGLAVSVRFAMAQAAAARAAAEVLGPPREMDLDALGLRAARLAREILTAGTAEWIADIPDDELPPLAAAVAAEGRAMGAARMIAASREMAEVAQAVWRLFREVDVIAMPVLSGPPPCVGHFDMASRDTGAHFTAMEALAPNIALANVAGIPALALPFGLHDGLPVGVQLMAPMGGEARLLAYAARIERVAGPLAFPYPIAGLPA